MSLKKLVGLAAIGGLLYAHKKRGGQMTVESFKDTARSLLDDAKVRVQDLRTQAEQKMQERQEGGRLGDDATGYGSSGYRYERH